MNVLYLTGAAPAGDEATLSQLAQVVPPLKLTTAASANEALQAIRGNSSFHTLITSPSLAQNETLALITSLRRDRVPIAIVPVVAEAHQDFFASAVSSGADDVLMMRGDTLNRVTETMTRIRQSPYLFPAENRRHLRVLYAGRDAVVWALLEQIPFVKVERATCASDGGCPVRNPGASDGGLRCDVMVVDEQPGDAHPLQVIKSVKAQASDLPVVVLTAPTGAEVAIAALDLGADDTVTKTGIYRRRLIATLRRLHQRIELTAQHEEVRAREARLRQIVERVPHGIAVISGDGTVLAMNDSALAVVGAARPKDVVGRNFRTFVAPGGRDEVSQLLRRVSGGDTASADFEVELTDGLTRTARLRGVSLERDARGRRGVLATLQAADPGGADSADTHQLQLELRQAQIALRETSDRQADLEKQLAAERETATVSRRQLEERAAMDRETEAHARAAVEAALEATRADLARTQATHEAERREWEVEHADLHLRQDEEHQSAEGTRIELETALAAARSEAQQLQVATQEERTAWDTTRAELDLRLREAEGHFAERARWDAEREALASALDQLRQAADVDRNDRAAWEASTGDLRARIAELESALAGSRDDEQRHDAARADLQEAIDDARRELHQAVEAYGAERAAWNGAREHLEGELARIHDERRLDAARWTAERGVLETAHANLQHAMDAAIADMRRNSDAASADRLIWEETRQALAARVEELAAHAADRDAVRAALEAAHEGLRQASSRLADEQAVWDQARAALEERVQDLQNQIGNQQEIEAALDATRSELEQTVGAQDLERAVWQAERRDLDDRFERAQRAVDEQQRLWDATREVLDQEVALYREREEQDRDELARLREAQRVHEQAQQVHDGNMREAADRLDRLVEAAQADQARLVEELARTAARLERLQNGDLFGYSIMTLDGQLIRCNDVFARMLGFVDAEDALVHTSGDPLAAMVDREDFDLRLSASGRTQAVETCLTRTDGQTIRVVESAVVVPGAPGEEPVVERILLDLGSQALLEEQLRRARRLEEVGNVATAMAPDIEDLLRSIGESATQLAFRADHSSEQRSEVETIVAGAARATEMLRQLLAFSRKQGRAPEPVDLNDAVRRAEPTLARLVGPHIDFSIQLGQADIVAAADDDLEQLLTTLVVSARDLLPIGGVIRIETGGLDAASRGDSPIDDGAPTAHQTLSVVAAGYGLQPAQATAAVALVARRCGGEISISGEPGRRAVLQVRFPRCSASPGSNW